MLQIFADAHFKCGHDHNLFGCQDYALSGTNSVFLSDGCSFGAQTPKPPTDIGARILCHLASQTPMPEGPATLEYFQSLLERAKEHGDWIRRPESTDWLLGRDNMDWLAATLWGIRSIGTQFHVFGMGDGIVAARRKDRASIDFWRIHPYMENSPLYPYYILFQDESLHRLPSGAQIPCVSGKILPDGTLDSESESKFQGVFNLHLSQEDYDLVSVFSDGLETLVSPTENGMWREIPIQSSLPILLDIKNYISGFAARKLQSLSWRMEGYRHKDDMSMAILAAVEVKS